MKLVSGLTTRGDFEASEQLKALYREIAKRVHPDLSLDQRSRNRRTQLMAEANLAYAEGNEILLRALLAEWLSSPESVDGEGVGADLVRTIRQIHLVKQRLPRIEAEILEIQASDMHILRSETAIAWGHGRDLLAEDQRQQLETENQQLKQQLTLLLSGKVHDEGVRQPSRWRYKPRLEEANSSR